MGSLIKPFFFVVQLLGLGSILSSDSLCMSLKGKFNSTVCPGDQDYPVASKAYNLRFTWKPAAITYPSTAEDISKIITIGAENNVKVVARSGGHSYIANGIGGQDGSLVIDLKHMTKITVNSSDNTAIIEAGNKLGDVALRLNTDKRALPHGVCPYVGIGGHTAFGGYGFTSRMWGLALDPIFAFNAVLANGTIVRATEANTTTSEIFWALKGAASSFAIITSLEVNTFAAPSYAIAKKYTWENVKYTDAATYLDLFQNFSLSGPPAEWAGELVITKGTKKGELKFELLGAWYGDKAKADSAVEPFLKKMPMYHSIETSGSGTYISSVEYLAGPGHPLDSSKNPGITDTFYAKSLMTPQNELMTSEATTAFMEYLANQGFYVEHLAWFVQIELYGGLHSKITEIASPDTAFARRDTLFTFQLYAYSPDSKPPYSTGGITFVDGMLDSITTNMPRDWNYGAYTDYIDDQLDNNEGLKRYYSDNLPKLVQYKKKYDSKDIFKFPTSIPTSIPGSTG